ncbi:hypothetical protein, partial [Corynebacterium nuruki]
MTVTPEALLAWLALPVDPARLPDALAAVRAAGAGGDSVVDWLADTADPDKDQRAVSEVRFPAPEDAWTAVALLLGHIQLLDHVNEAWNRNRAQEGSLPRPSLDVVSAADELATLTASVPSGTGPALTGALDAAAAALRAAHALEPLSAASRRS